MLKLGTLKELLPEHGPTRDDVMAWAREEARIETLKYKDEQKSKSDSGSYFRTCVFECDHYAIFTQIDIPTSSFIIITLLFIISESRFAAGHKSTK